MQCWAWGAVPYELLISHKSYLAENHVSIVTSGKWVAIKIYWKIPVIFKVSQHGWKKLKLSSSIQKESRWIKWEAHISNLWWSHAWLHWGWTFDEAREPFSETDIKFQVLLETWSFDESHTLPRKLFLKLTSKLHPTATRIWIILTLS